MKSKIKFTKSYITSTKCRHNFQILFENFKIFNFITYKINKKLPLIFFYPEKNNLDLGV